MDGPKISIGTDPELVFAKNGKLICAADVLTRPGGEFGLDGHKFIAELRPKPAISPRDLVESIRKILQTEASNLSAYTWHAGAWIFDKPLGGHIHFGVPSSDNIVDALDHQFAIALALIEPQKEAQTRRTTTFPGARDQRPYGLLSDVRDKPHGFEYRTPSSFIVSPGVSLGILALAKAVVYEEVVGGSCAWSNLPKHTRDELTFDKEDFYNCNKEIFRTREVKLWELISNMKYFAKGEEGRNLWSSVSFLKNKVAKNLGFLSKSDIKEKWKLLFKEKSLEEQSGLIADYYNQITIPTNHPLFWRDRYVDTVQPQIPPTQGVNTNVINLDFGLPNVDPDFIWGMVP